MMLRNPAHHPREGPGKGRWTGFVLGARVAIGGVVLGHRTIRVPPGVLRASLVLTAPHNRDQHHRTEHENGPECFHRLIALIV